MDDQYLDDPHTSLEDFQQTIIEWAMNDEGIYLAGRAIIHHAERFIDWDDTDLDSDKEKAMVEITEGLSALILEVFPRAQTRLLARVDWQEVRDCLVDE